MTSTAPQRGGLLDASRQRGFTLIEITVVLAIVAFVLTTLGAVVAQEIRIPIRVQSEIEASRQVQKATLLITEDANVAQSFTAGTGNDYGTFKWSEFSGTAPVPVTARYFWDDERVMRELIRGGDDTPPQVVLEPVLEYDDVVFTHTPTAWTFNESTKLWSYTEGKITVTLLTTHDAGSEFPATTITATLVSDLRPQTDLPAPIPGRLAPPTPPANQVGFRISGEPNLLTGTYRSGNGSNLTFDDSSYYVTRGSGSPRTIAWEATSEIIDYTTITNISIEFVGRVDRSGVSQSFFVYNPTDSEHSAVTGYAASPDESSVYPTSDTDRTVTFEFNSSDVAYVNSLATKVVKIKIMATDPSVFDHSADKLVFKVAGTPSTTFSRNFAVDTNPTIEAGSYVSGDFTGLATNDTSYYVAQESGNVIRWTAVSEAITLDTATSTQVTFVGRSTKGSPLIELFVYNPANGGDGFPTTANANITYTSINTDFSVSFFLNSADLTYVNTLFPKEVRIRIKGSGGGTQWRLEADHLIFTVKP